MQTVSSVRPKIWADVIDLYDDGDYSAIWGYCDKSAKRRLGVRWNGDDGYVGYPNQGKNPVWYNEPDFLERAILLRLLEELITKSSHQRKEVFISNMRTALNECT